jgi:hypothetical protein
MAAIEQCGTNCACDLSYDPVTCSNGHTYINQCLATCAGASGCGGLCACDDPTASADERERFQENLAKLCEEEARSTCAEVGIVSLRAASATAYAAVIAAYGQ